MKVLHHFLTMCSLFRATMSEQLDFGGTVASQVPEDISQNIVEGLARAQSLPVFGTDDESAVGSASSSSSDGIALSGTSAYSKWLQAFN